MGQQMVFNFRIVDKRKKIELSSLVFVFDLVSVKTDLHNTTFA